MVSQKSWSGVQCLLDEYICWRPDDTVIISFTPDSMTVSAWVAAAIALRGSSVTQVPMYPIDDPGFFERFVAVLPEPEQLAGRLVIITLERETMSHDGALRRAICQYDINRCMVIRSISSSDELFSSALRIPPDELSRLNTTILEHCMPATKLHIETSSGTSLDIELDSNRHRWISNRGKWRPGHFVILPAGEVATFPSSINGRLVADFAFNVNALTERSARLDNHPVHVDIEGGRAVNYGCENSQVMSFLEECFSTHCAFNVGELGFGTNKRVMRSIDLNSHINERRPGVHIGFGQHNQGKAVDYSCNIHLDLIAKGGKIWIDDDQLPVDLENIVPSDNEHPNRTRDEDVFSPNIDDLEIDDCCGILTKERLVLFSEMSKDAGAGQLLGQMVK